MTAVEWLSMLPSPGTLAGWIIAGAVVGMLVLVRFSR